jgi:tRNA threonylcarbamoyladenosine biosynthesis protein TsaB
MRILAIDSSATAASAALVEDGKVLGEFYINTRLTHSQTLMPMINDVLSCTQSDLSSVDLFAVSAGPGSFTGIRIGVASIKGLAMVRNKPCVGVSTLEAMAFNLEHMEGTVCAVMDARCEQVYNAMFQVHDGRLERLTPDRALSIEALAKECENYQKPLFLVGDGAELCYNNQWFKNLNAILPSEPLIYQRACGVAKSALVVYEQGGSVTPAALMPIYLRLPQAERELKKRLKGVNKC